MTPSITQCIQWKLDSNEYVITPNKTLVEIYNKNLTLREDEYYFNNERELFVCVPSAYQPPFYYIDLMYVGEWTVSTISLILCVIIHYAKSNSNANRSLVCHQISLIAFYLSGIIYILAQSDSVPWFSFIRYLASYSSRAAFCWLTVINFDKWRTLRPENITRITTSTKKFCFESLFAWSVPAILIGIASALEYLGVTYPSEYMILHHSDTQVIFWDGSGAVILVVNVVLFLMTVRNLRRYGKSINRANKKIFDQLAAVYLKLMIVSGINWVLVVAEWSVIFHLPDSFWVFVDTVYGLQGFFIFIIYHCKISTLKKCGKKLCPRNASSGQNATI